MNPCYFCASTSIFKEVRSPTCSFTLMFQRAQVSLITPWDQGLNLSLHIWTDTGVNGNVTRVQRHTTAAHGNSVLLINYDIIMRNVLNMCCWITKYYWWTVSCQFLQAQFLIFHSIFQCHGVWGHVDHVLSWCFLFAIASKESLEQLLSCVTFHAINNTKTSTLL